MIKEIKNYALLYKYHLIFVIIAYVPLFLHLDWYVLRVFDEARLANNAIEMYDNNNFIVTFFDNKPDMWNTKPPLLIWIQVLFFKLFGINEISLRLPSALSALFTGFLFLSFSKKHFNSFRIGFFSSLVLITTNGFINMHAARSGDYDSLLSFFVLGFILSYYNFLKFKKDNYLVFFFIFLILSTMTKGIAPLIFMPGLFLYTLFSKNLILLLKNKYFYVGIFSFLFIVGGYYFLRNLYNPGFILQMFENEIGGRFLTTLEGHKHDDNFYFTFLFKIGFSYWIFFVLFGVFIGVVYNDSKINDLIKYLIVIVFSFIILLSFGQTKIEWYLVPIYPLLAIIVGFAIDYFYDLLSKINLQFFKVRRNPFVYIYVFLAFVYPYNTTLNHTYMPRDYSEDEILYSPAYVLREILNGKHNVSNCCFVIDDYCPQNIFYIKLLNKKNKNIRIKNIDQVVHGDNIMVYSKSIINTLKIKHKLEYLNSFGTIKYFKVLK